MNIVQRMSPNQSARTNGVGIDCIVLHADAGKTDEGTIAWIESPDSKVSYHYLIDRAGVVHQFVPDERKAWHAGVSRFKGRDNCNDYSIGVSFANDQRGEPIAPDQVVVGAELVALLCLRHKIPVDRITTHAVVSPGRKRDPGSLFPLSAFLNHVRAELA
jgi:N-acetylmuramoyl-L-alanine amidase